MSVAGCRRRQSVEVKIFKIGPIYDMLSEVGKASRLEDWKTGSHRTESTVFSVDFFLRELRREYMYLLPCKCKMAF